MFRTKNDPIRLKIPPYEGFEPDPEAVKLLHQYLTQRIQAYHRKEEGKHPYSREPVMSTYKFTNVFREYDRVSKAIIEALKSHENADPDILFANLVKWRMTNTELMANTWDTNFKSSPDYPDEEAFTDAFMTVGLRHRQSVLCPGAKTGVEAVYGIVKKHVLDAKLYTSKIQKTKDPYQALESMKTIPGIADFLSYQIFVDCTYVRPFTDNVTFKFKWSENACSIAGPGCHRGLMLVFPTAPHSKDKIQDAETRLFWLTEYWSELCQAYNLKWNIDRLFRERVPEDRYINVMAWENVMCEFQKYTRLVTGNKLRARKYMEVK